MARSSARSRHDVLKFVERYADLMIEAGIPRMPARVFAALFSADSGRLTAAEIGELLHVSPAAVSGAVRYLMQTRLIRREREPRSRRDVYALYSEVWYEAIVNRQDIVAQWQASMREGADLLGPETPAGRRLAEGAEFFDFILVELPVMLERWRAHKAHRQPENE